MPQPGKVDINATIAAWADIVIKIWREKITELQVYDKGELERSLLRDLVKASGEDIQKIEFSFKLYGKFADMGVGREVSRGNSGDIGYKPTRKAKPWFSKKFFGQILKLREIMMEQYSRSVTYTILNGMNESFDSRYKDIGTARTLSSLRSVEYRPQQHKRNASNYQRRREMPGKWSGGKYWKPD